MELGIHIPLFEIDGGTTAVAAELARVGAAADEAGATWLSLMDHYFQVEQIGLPPESSMLEGYTTLAFLAAHTSKVNLGLLVTGVTYRHPGLLAKIVTTLDVLSGGRAVLGVGRDFGTIRTTIAAMKPRPEPGTREAFVRQMAPYARLGVHTAIITPVVGSPAAWIDGMAPVVPQLAELG
jgi:alkanesulfonate monooxygenase SsuD/methylene tetrahydromethanopterin reductase-like flavin-dependent oxidoreductase (luciferase family)